MTFGGFFCKYEFTIDGGFFLRQRYHFLTSNLQFLEIKFDFFCKEGITSERSGNVGLSWNDTVLANGNNKFGQRWN